MNRNSRIVMFALALVFSFSLTAYSSDNIYYDNYLISSLQDENIGIRTSAATLLGERKVNEAVEPLLEMFKKEKNYSARIVAALSLYKIGDESVLPFLKERAMKDKNKTVRHVLIGIVMEMEGGKLVMSR